MALATHPKLAQLIHAFQRALAQEQASRWQEIDLAVQIADAFPDHGLAQLAAETGLHPSTLTHYVAIGRTFPSAVRQPYLRLSYSHFREAVTAARQHPNTIGANPLWWLERALREGWSCGDLRHHAKHDLSSATETPHTPDPAEQTQRLTLLIREGNGLRIRLAQTIYDYNQRYAPFTGVRLVLTAEPYTVS